MGGDSEGGRVRWMDDLLIVAHKWSIRHCLLVFRTTYCHHHQQWYGKRFASSLRWSPFGQWVRVTSLRGRDVLYQRCLIS